ncbi:MAG: hypothetical protein K9M44_01400 [Candidatus Pacebacteria bacterium]|nr:hypothetical protein [Candidatus Paceibacterota bacterium]
MNNKEINKILEELYMIDKELKAHETELKKIIKELSETRPDIKPDQAFVSELRQKLMLEAKGADKNPAFTWSLSKKMALAGATLIILALVIIPYYNLKNKDLNSLKQANKNKDNRFAMEDLGDRAFGSLNFTPSDSAGVFSEGASPLEASVSSQRVMGLGAGGDISDSALSSKMIMPNPIVYEYKYVGDDFEIDYEKAKVIKRKTSEGFSGSQINLSGFKVGKIDYSKFKSLTLTNVNLVEDVDFGYNLNLDLVSDNLSLYANWEKWPTVDCQDEACFRNWQLKISDMPSDDKIVQTADKFLQDYGIDIGVYGQGQVFDDWRYHYTRSEDKSNFYIPETVNVVYPLVIDGQIVYDEQGNVSGLGVDVNVRYDKVSSVRGIMSQVYQSSDYEAFTDKEEIIDIAEEGGFRNYNYYIMENSEVREVKLDTPSLELVKIWQYDESKKRGEEIFVPAYVFPVIFEENSDMYYRKAVIVPVVKEIIEKEQRNRPQPMPMPAVRGGGVDIMEEPVVEPMIEPQIMIEE